MTLKINPDTGRVTAHERNRLDMALTRINRERRLTEDALIKRIGRPFPCPKCSRSGFLCSSLLNYYVTCECCGAVVVKNRK